MSVPDRTMAEARRYRAGSASADDRRRGRGRQDPTDRSAHPMLFSMRPAVELADFPSGGGYPVGFVEAACTLMGVDPHAVVHLCAGSVRGGRLTIDIRPAAGADVVADVRWLPLGAATVDAILVDPPYDPEYAEALWGEGRRFPTPMVIMREAAHALRPGGRVGMLHHLVPVLPPELRQVAVCGVATGPGYRMRAFTVAERIDPPAELGL